MDTTNAIGDPVARAVSQQNFGMQIFLGWSNPN